MTDSAVDRETAWLQTSGDNLPALQTADGGPWDVVQSYWPRTQTTRQTGLYVMRHRIADRRIANQRRWRNYPLRVRAWWPIGATTTSSGLWEDEQRALDAAIDLLLTRVEGLLLDHTHGGRFLAVAEDPDVIDVAFSDPTQAATVGAFTADITYTATDFDYVS